MHSKSQISKAFFDEIKSRPVITESDSEEAELMKDLVFKALDRLPSQPLQLTVTDPTAALFTDAVGITPQRVDELAKLLDKMVEKYAGQAIRTWDVINEIWAMAQSIEEFSYCIITHMEFRRCKRWPLICPPKSKYLP